MPRPVHPLLSRLGLSLAILAVLGTPLRATGAAHCDPLVAGDAPAHSGQHHAPGESGGTSTEDKGTHGGCPHCPPLECAQQVSCAQLVTEMVASPAAEGQPKVELIAVPFGAVHPIACTTPPPTPPPQLEA